MRAAKKLTRANTKLGRCDRGVTGRQRDPRHPRDNYSTHKRNEEWLAKYEGKVVFHFTPTSASWLNQVEIWFSLLLRKTLIGASFKGKEPLREAIQAFIATTNRNRRPFPWPKRAVKGTQLRNTLINLRN